MANWGLAVQNWIGAQTLSLFGSTEVSVAIVLMLVTGFVFLTGFSAEVKLISLLLLMGALLAPAILTDPVTGAQNVGGAALLTDSYYFYFVVLIAALLIAFAIMKFRSSR